MKIKFFQLLLLCALSFPAAVMAQGKKAATPAKKPVPASASAVAASITRGKVVYTASCLPCHQADGSGVPNLNPPLIKTKWVLGSKTVLVQQILKGSSGQVEIDGDTFHNTMPSMAQLTDQQIADVLTYVRNSFGNKASLVTPAEVKAIRAKTK